MQVFKVRWVDRLENEAGKSYKLKLSDERLTLNQIKRMKQVNATLARQGFTLYETDASGFAVYHQTGRRSIGRG